MGATRATDKDITYTSLIYLQGSSTENNPDLWQTVYEIVKYEHFVLDDSVVLSH